MTTPTAGDERVGLIDALRGFALFGVLATNLNLFTGRWGVPPAEAATLWTSTADKVTNVAAAVLLMGKSITLFSFLFGVGFAVYLERSDVRRWARRLAIMMAIGTIHAFLIWAGDILTLYAALGFALLLFRRMGDRKLVTLAVVLFAMQAAGTALRLALPMSGGRPGQAALAIVVAETWPAALAANTRLWLAYHATPMSVFFMATILGRIVLGYVAGRRRLLHDPDLHRPFFTKLLYASIGVAIASTVGLFFAERGGFGMGSRSPVRIPMSLLEETGMLSMASVYLCTFALLWRRPGFRRVAAPLESVGRMALTNYLTQSVVCTLYFYTWPHLGPSHRVGPAASMLFAVVLYTIQIVISRVWLRYFRFGPVEWVWRSLTYGRRQPLRKQPLAAVA